MRTHAAVIMLIVFTMALSTSSDLATPSARAQEDANLIVPRDAVLPVPEQAQTSVEDWYIVILRDDVADPGLVAAELAQAHGLLVSHVYREAFPGFAARIPPASLASVEGDPRVVSVQPDEVVGLDSQSEPAGTRRIEVAPAAKNAVAQIDGNDERIDVDVAVLDSGIDASHPDLNYAGGFDCVNAGAAASPDVDAFGHGTHIAGIIGALDNDYGVVGVTPGARLWSVKVLGDDNRTNLSTVLCGIEHVTLNAGRYDVANMSFFLLYTNADDGNCGFTDGKLMHQQVCAAVAAGVTVVASAGNRCQDAKVQAPAAFDEVITVSAMVDTDGRPGGFGAPGAINPGCNTTTSDADDTFADFSSFGPDVDLAAPGVDVLSTVPVSGNPAGYAHPSGYNTADGTSFAAAYGSGAAALYLATHPGATPSQVRSALIADREQVGLQGDPDGINEGVLNVNDGSPWAGDGGGPDTTPPTAPVLTIIENEPDEFVKGNTVYFNPANRHEGVFTVVADTTDPETGVTRVQFPNLFGNNPVSDGDPPFQKGYRWTDDDRTGRTRGITATNGVGLSSTTDISVVPDMQNPVLVTEDNFVDFDGDVVKVRAHDGNGSGLVKVEIRWCPGTCSWASATSLGVNTTDPFEYIWTDQPTFRYTIMAQVWDGVGRSSGVKATTLNPPSPTRQLAATAQGDEDPVAVELTPDGLAAEPQADDEYAEPPEAAQPATAEKRRDSGPNNKRADRGNESASERGKQKDKRHRSPRGNKRSSHQSSHQQSRDEIHPSSIDRDKRNGNFERDRRRSRAQAEATERMETKR